MHRFNFLLSCLCPCHASVSLDPSGLLIHFYGQKPPHSFMASPGLKGRVLTLLARARKQSGHDSQPAGRLLAAPAAAAAFLFPAADAAATSTTLSPRTNTCRSWRRRCSCCRTQRTRSQLPSTPAGQQGITHWRTRLFSSKHSSGRCRSMLLAGWLPCRLAAPAPEWHLQPHVPARGGFTFWTLSSTVYRSSTSRSTRFMCLSNATSTPAAAARMGQGCIAPAQSQHNPIIGACRAGDADVLMAAETHASIVSSESAHEQGRRPSHLPRCRERRGHAG
jgi:hypothetical protein